MKQPSMCLQERLSGQRPAPRLVLHFNHPSRSGSSVTLRLRIAGWRCGVLLLLGAVAAVHGATLTVGPGGGCGFTNLTTALAAAHAGDLIQVSPGTYAAPGGEVFPLLIDKPLTLEWAAPANRPHLQGDHTNTVLLITSSAVTVRGLRITDGLGSQGIYRKDGGGICIFVDATAEGQVLIEQCVVENNTCPSDATYAGSGGGIYCGGTWCTCFEIGLVDCLIRSNTVPGLGAGVFCGLLSQVWIERSTIGGNAAADSGGGVFVDAYGLAMLTNCLVWTNTAGATGLGSGGGVFVEANSLCAMEHSQLVGNYAEGFGGGLFSFSSVSNLVLGCGLPGGGEAGLFFTRHGLTNAVVDSLLAHNRAGLDGGGAYLGANAFLAFHTSTNYWNDAGRDGGGVCVADSAGRSAAGPEFGRGSWFEGNECIGSGGGVYLGRNRQATVMDSRLLGNVAGRDGGGVMLNTAAGGVLSNCVLTYNSAARGQGGGLCVAPSASNSMSHCTVVGNFAPAARAGICLTSNALLTATNCILWRNAGGSVETNGTSALAYSLCEDLDAFGPGVVHGSPRFVGWGSNATVYADAAAVLPGSGTVSGPFRTLQLALEAFDFCLGADSPCRGTANDGGNMGAFTGSGGAAGNPSTILNLAPGAYDMRGRNLALVHRAQGAGPAATAIRHAVFGCVGASSLADLAITSEAWFGGLTTRGDLELTGCRVYDNECFSDGGGAYFADGAIVVTNCQVELNGCGDRGGGIVLADGLQLIMEGCGVLENASVNHGGGLYLGNNTRTVLSRTEISDNKNDRFGQMSPAWGGGIYALSVESLDVLDCQISRNRSCLNGGGLVTGGLATLLNSTVSTNQTQDDGGGAYIAGALLASNSWFTANAATSPSLDNRGGGMIVKSTANVLIRVSHFTANVGQDRGSGITVEGPTTLLDSEFVGNGARNGYRYGGAIEANSGAYPLASNCLFRANFGNYGGGAYINGGKSPAFLACRFEGNSANIHGGVGWCLGNSAAFFDECRFETNQAAQDGGAFNAGSSRLVVQNSDFIANTANRGGAVVTTGTDQARFLACNFINSQAGALGGALYLTDTAATLIEGGVMATNQCQGNGGAIACDSLATITLSGVQILASQGADGGALYATGASTARVDRCQFQGNLADDFANDADGGAAQITDHAVGYFTCSRLAQNLAKDDGGGIAVDGAAQVFFTNVFLVQNTAGDSGGGAYFYGHTTGQFVNCTFAANTAVDSDGGGLWLDNAASVALDSSIVFANSPDDIRVLATPVIHYTCVGTLWAGTGNFTNDPLFETGFALGDGSPCIDGGNPAPRMNDTAFPPAKGTPRNDAGATGGPLNCCQPLVDNGWLWAPPLTGTEVGVPSEWIRGRVQVLGLTEAAGQAPGIEAWLGYGAIGSSPSNWTGWVPGNYVQEMAGADEYAAPVTPAAPGEYRYAWRFRRDGGPWFYADLDGGANGIASDQLGILHVGDFTPADFGYQNFDAPFGLVLVGQASLTNGLLRLNRDSALETGGAWHAHRVRVEQAFATVFRFRISRNGANGFACVIQNGNPGALGSSGSYLGYDLTNSVAVEFDTWNNPLGDPNANHISVHTRGVLVNDRNHAYSLGCADNLSVDMSDGQPHSVRVTYAPGIVRVFLDDLNEPVLAVPLDLAATLHLTGGRAWIGFTGTAGGGANFEAHDILEWRFQHGLTPVADTDGDGLPDWWELRYFGGATNGVPDADGDTDGATTRQEYMADTDPTDRASVFKITSLAVDTQVVVQAWTSVRRIYLLERCDLPGLLVPWEPQGGWASGHDGWLQLTSTNLNQPAGFRLRVAGP